MRGFKKSISVLLTAMMIATGLPGLAYAEETNETEDLLTTDTAQIEEKAEEQSNDDNANLESIDDEEETAEVNDAENLLKGVCGEHAEYSYNPETNILTISGSGSLNDHDQRNYCGDDIDSDFSDTIRSNTKKIVIQDGITRIGIQAFLCFYSLECVEIAATVTEIGDFAFFVRCDSLELHFQGTPPECGKTIAYPGVTQVIHDSDVTGWIEDGGIWNGFNVYTEHSHNIRSTTKKAVLIDTPYEGPSYGEDDTYIDTHDYVIPGYTGKICGNCGHASNVDKTIWGFIYQIPKATYNYTGKTIKPTVGFYGYADEFIDGDCIEYEFKEGTDYTVTYGSNKKIGSGTGWVKITGIGKYLTGSTTFTFDILGPHLKSENVSLLMGKSYTNSLLGNTAKVTWSSSNKKIATVSSKGVIKGIKPGSCTIKAKAGKKSYSCKVTVSKPVLSSTELVLNRTKTKTLTVSGGTGTTKWYSSNTRVATISSKGVVTAKKAGACTITAKRNGYKLKCAVTVTDIATLNVHELDLQVTEKYQLTVCAGNGENSWETSNADVADVNADGKIVAIAPGECTITLYKGEQQDQCAVTVTEKPDNLFFADGGSVDFDVDPNSCSEVFVRYTATKTGCIILDFDDDDKYENIVICDSYYDPYEIERHASQIDMFDAEKGETYYLKIKLNQWYYDYDYDDSGDTTHYSIDIKNYTVKDYNRHSKSSGKYMARKTYYYGTVIEDAKYYSYDDYDDEDEDYDNGYWEAISEKDWFRFKLSKKSKFKVRISVVGNCDITIYRGSKVIYIDGDSYLELEDETTTIYTNSKMSAGTYYIRIRGNGGKYSVKWY